MSQERRRVIPSPDLTIFPKTQVDIQLLVFCFLVQALVEKQHIAGCLPSVAAQQVLDVGSDPKTRQVSAFALTATELFGDFAVQEHCPKQFRHSSTGVVAAMARHNLESPQNLR